MKVDQYNVINVKDGLIRNASEYKINKHYKIIYVLDVH